MSSLDFSADMILRVLIQLVWCLKELFEQGISMEALAGNLRYSKFIEPGDHFGLSDNIPISTMCGGAYGYHVSRIDFERTLITYLLCTFPRIVPMYHMGARSQSCFSHRERLLSIAFDNQKFEMFCHSSQD